MLLLCRFALSSCSTKVVRKSLSPAIAIPPCPAFGNLVRQRIFSPRATLQWVGASETALCQLPFGPAAWGHSTVIFSAPLTMVHPINTVIHKFKFRMIVIQ